MEAFASVQKEVRSLRRLVWTMGIVYGIILLGLMYGVFYLNMSHKALRGKTGQWELLGRITTDQR
jgi:hypothetical protein